MAVRQQNDLRLYLDVIPDPSHVSSLGYFNFPQMLTYCIQPEIPAGSIMIFLKHFDIANQKLTGVGKVYVPRASKVSDLIPIINERMRWTSTTPLKLYEVRNQVPLEAIVVADIAGSGNQTGHD